MKLFWYTWKCTVHVCFVITHNQHDNAKQHYTHSIPRSFVLYLHHVCFTQPLFGVKPAMSVFRNCSWEVFGPFLQFFDCDNILDEPSVISCKSDWFKFHQDHDVTFKKYFQIWFVVLELWRTLSWIFFVTDLLKCPYHQNFYFLSDSTYHPMNFSKNKNWFG